MEHKHIARLHFTGDPRVSVLTNTENIIERKHKKGKWQWGKMAPTAHNSTLLTYTDALMASLRCITSSQPDMDLLVKSDGTLKYCIVHILLDRTVWSGEKHSFLHGWPLVSPSGIVLPFMFKQQRNEISTLDKQLFVLRVTRMKRLGWSCGWFAWMDCVNSNASWVRR